MSGDGIPGRAVGVLGLGMLGLGLAVGGFGAYVTALVELGVSPQMAGLGSTLFLLAQVLIVLPVDVLSRRWSVRYAAAGGLTLGAIGIALGGILAIHLHLTGRLVLGFGMGATFLAAMKYGGRRTRGRSVARTQALLGALFTLGLAIGIPTMPWAVGQFGPVLPAIGASIPVFASALLATTLRPVGSEPVVPVGAYLAPFRNPVEVSFGLANAASYGLLIVATTWYADIVAGSPALPLTLVLTGFATATFLGRTGSGWLSGLTNPARAVGGSLFYLAGALALVAAALATDSTLLLAAGLVLSGFGFGLPFGSLFSLAFSNVKSDAGVLLVGMTMLGNGAALAFPWLVGWLLGATDGFVAGFLVMAVAVVVVGVIWERTVVAA